MATWKTNIPEINRVLLQSRGPALIVAAQILINAVKRGLRGGYTSGDFATGTSVNHVTRTDPVAIGDEMKLAVGTNLLYDLMWEIGHHNLYTGRYERVEVWVPALHASAVQMKNAYGAYIKAQLARIRPL